MKFAGKKLLFIDIETSGLPLTRKSVSRYDKYVSPDINIAYSKSRLLSLSVISGMPARTGSWFRDTSDLTDDAYTTNKGKYSDKPKHTITQILSESLKYFEKCDYVIGHNVLFDLHIIANEYIRHEHVHDNVITDIINKSRYFCTLMMAKMIGIDDKDIDLQSMVKRFTNTNATFKYHESCDDVAATKLVFESGITKLNAIPSVIDGMTDKIYPPTIFGNCDGRHLLMKVTKNVFQYYIDTIKPLGYKYYVSGKLELYLSEEQFTKLDLHKLMTLDGVCYIHGYTHDTRYIIDDIIHYCNICKSEMIGMAVCDKCINDDVFRFAEQFGAIEADFSNTISVTELKARLKDVKGNARRNGVLTIETHKKGRSLVIPLNKVEFYSANRLYEYFSIKVGSAKL